MDAFKGSRDWYYLYPNINRLDMLDWGIDQLIASAQEYGWDGVRFDGDFSWAANDEVGARNQRRMKERIWAKLPNFVFGYNISFSPTEETPDKWTHALREGLAGGGHYMHEAIRDYAYASNGRYSSYHDYWTKESAACEHVRQLGASYHFIYDLNHLKSPEQKIYKFVLGTSAGAHPVYGDSAIAGGCANWGRFLTRWSAFVWDTNLRNRPDAEARVTCRRAALAGGEGTRGGCEGYGYRGPPHRAAHGGQRGYAGHRRRTAGQAESHRAGQSR